MKIVVIMSCASPWSRSAVLELITLGQSVHVVDFAPQGGREEYLSIHADFQRESIADFCAKISDLHLLQTSSVSSLKYLAATPQLKRILASVKPDVLLTLYGGGLASLAYMSGFRPFAVYAVGSDVLMANGWRKLLGRMSLHAAGAVFANGRYLAGKTRELAPKAYVIPLLLGIDLNRWTRNEYPPEPVRIICTRGFMPVYNNEYLIEGLSRMPVDLPEFTVTFVSNGPLLSDVRHRADTLLPQPLRDKVEFLDGVSDETLKSLVGQSHIYVSLSRSDGTSISLLEALSCGLFPVLSDIPQNREWIDTHSNNGYLVPLDHPSLLAEALTNAIRRHDIRRSASATNRHLIEAHADSHANMSLLLKELEKVLHGRGK